MRTLAGRAALIAVALVVAVTGGAAAAVRPYDATKIYPTEEAFTQAIKGYQDALAANPKDVEAAYWLGYAYWEVSALFRNGVVPYGGGYLALSIEALEKAVANDDKHMGAWMLLTVAYFARGYAPGPLDKRDATDQQKSEDAMQKVIALSHDPAAAYRGVPPARKRSEEIPVKYAPIHDRAATVTAVDEIVVGDADTKLLYRLSCASLPAIQRPAVFLTKWEAFDRGYKAATVCPPP